MQKPVSSPTTQTTVQALFLETIILLQHTEVFCVYLRFCHIEC